MFNGRDLKCCGTMEQANGELRKLVSEDCNRIGINDWKIINEILRTNNHQYTIVQDLEFDDVGNVIREGCYYVCLKSKRS